MLLQRGSRQAVCPAAATTPTIRHLHTYRHATRPGVLRQAIAPAPAPQRRHAARHRISTQMRVAMADTEQDEEDFDEEEALKSLSYVDRLNYEYGIPNMIMFSEGDNGLPRVWIKHVDSSMGVELYLHGATLTTWLRPNGSPALSPHPGLSLHPDRGNKGAGLRLAFPQFRAGAAMTLEDGFAGRLPWEVVAAGLGFMPLPDGMDEGMQARIDEYLRIQEEEPELLEDPPELDDPLAGDELILERDDEEWPEEQLEEQGEEPREEPREETGEEGAEGSQVAATDQADQGTKKQRGRPKKADSQAPSAAGQAGKLSSSSRQQLGTQPAGQEQEGLQQGEEGEAGVRAQQGQGEGAEEEGQEEEGEEGQGVGAGGQEEEEELAEDEFKGPDGETYIKVDEIHEAAMDMLLRLQEGLDPAPFITLRLQDTEETRAVWPHKFALYYKLSVMEQDDYPSTEPADNGLTTAQGDSVAALMRDDINATQRMVDNAPEPVTAVGGRLDTSTGLEVPVQLKIQLLLVNKDEEGSEDMEFQMAALMQFATQDVLTKGQFVKVLGLGNTSAIDYAHDERTGAVMSEENDYVTFLGHKIDATYTRALRSDVKVAPGDGTHYEFLPRRGFTDVSVYHPGVSFRNANDPSRKLAGVGVGRMAAPKTLEAGESWYGEVALRWHNHMWVEPIFGDDAPFVPDLDESEYQTEEGTNIFSGVDPGEDDGTTTGPAP